jgi:hypothetical protein
MNVEEVIHEDMKVWSGFKWLRIRTSYRLL